MLGWTTHMQFGTELFAISNMEKTCQNHWRTQASLSSGRSCHRVARSGGGTGVAGSAVEHRKRTCMAEASIESSYTTPRTHQYR